MALEHGFWKWAPRITLLLTIVAVIGIMALVILRFHDSATAQGQEQTVARQDCRSRIAADQTAVRDRRDNIQAQIVQAFAADAAQGTRATPAQLATILDLSHKEDAAIAAVNKLPNLQTVVAKECPGVGP